MSRKNVNKYVLTKTFVFFLHITARACEMRVKKRIIIGSRIFRIGQSEALKFDHTLR